MRGLLSFVVRNDHSPSNYSSAHFEELQLLVKSNTTPDPAVFNVCVCVCVCCAGIVMSVYPGTAVSGAVHGVSGEHSSPSHPRVVPQLPQ